MSESERRRLRAGLGDLIKKVKSYQQELTAQAETAATISASQEDRAMLFCLVEPQDMAAWLNTKTFPDVECLVAQSESDIP